MLIYLIYFVNTLFILSFDISIFSQFVLLLFSLLLFICFTFSLIICLPLFSRRQVLYAQIWHKKSFGLYICPIFISYSQLGQILLSCGSVGQYPSSPDFTLSTYPSPYFSLASCSIFSKSS